MTNSVVPIPKAPAASAHNAIGMSNAPVTGRGAPRGCAFCACIFMRKSGIKSLDL
ncbi:Uncharacterised protein [Bordetella pertussis]|nr:Uncharacterised protein [Bordetella pertussis]